MTPRIRGESQRAYVERVLRTESSVSAWDCLYEGEYVDGGGWSITRLAAIIWSLRHEDGLDITESAEDGRLATYTYHGHTGTPAWARSWRCVACGDNPDSAPRELLGGIGVASCRHCGHEQHFRRAA